MAVPVGTTRASAYDSSSDLLTSAPLLASRKSCAGTERGPGKMRLETIVCGPPVARELRPARETETTANEASADPMTAPQRTGRLIEGGSAELRGARRRILVLVPLAVGGNAPDPPQPEQGQEERRGEDRDRPDDRASQPGDRQARLWDDEPDAPRGRALQLRDPRVTRVVRVSLRADDRVVAAAEDGDHAVGLHVMIADGDVEADHLPHPDVSSGLGRDDDQVAGPEHRPHAAREHGLGPVPARVGQEPEQDQHEDRE